MNTEPPFIATLTVTGTVVIAVPFVTSICPSYRPTGVPAGTVTVGLKAKVPRPVTDALAGTPVTQVHARRAKNSISIVTGVFTAGPAMWRHQIARPACVRTFGS